MKKAGKFLIGIIAVFVLFFVIGTVLDKFPSLFNGFGYSGIEYTIDYENSEVTITGIGSFSGISLEIPEQIDGYTVTKIADKAFYCSIVSYITLPDTIEYIGEQAFRSCSALLKIYNLEDTQITRVNAGTFESCPNLAIDKLPDTVTYIGDSAFSWCTFESFELPSSLIEIDNNAFANCENLKSIVLPDSLERLGRYAFYACTSLESINIPSKLLVLEEGTFIDCKSLASVSMNEVVYDIEYAVFKNCESLKEIYIPKTVKSIEGDVFYGTSVTSITFGGTVSEWRDVYKPDSWHSGLDELVITCTQGKVDKDGNIIRN